jgi:uncharacterized protein (DUF1697 family)
MPKYIAFLRAINVGGHIVKMDRLRALFEEIGFSKVETFIASGNVIFETANKNTKTLTQKIESHLHENLSYKVGTFLRTTAELAAVARHKPFSDHELSQPAHSLYIVFLPDEPSAEAKEKMLALTTEVDDFSFRDRELYWLCRTKFNESLFKGNLEKILGMPGTMRNSTTVRKIAAKHPG